MADDERQQTRRQYVRFLLYKIDPAWRLLPKEQRERGKEELCAAVEAFGSRMLVRSYSLVGTRSDADLLLWQISDRMDDFQELATAVCSTALGPYLLTPYSYLAMTRRSAYVSPEESREASRLIIQPTDARYLFVYPFVKTRPWYKLSQDERQEMMNVHIAIGRKYPSVKLNTTYSFGLDDQEFVVAFETDEPGDFLDLVMELRETDTSLYTLRDTPIFTGVAMSLREALDALGAPGDARPVASDGRTDGQTGGWTAVGQLSEIAEGAARVVHLRGEPVAIFNIGGRLYAIGNRCSHANGPLAEGKLDGTKVTCPWHDSQFDITTGAATRTPAERPVPAYRVKVDGATVLLAPQETTASTAP